VRETEAIAVNPQPILRAIEGGPEALSPSISLEEDLLKRTSLTSLDKIPEADFVVVKKAIAIDALRLPLALNDRKKLLIYSLWQHSGNYDLARKYLGISKFWEIGWAIDDVWKDSEKKGLTEAYEKADFIYNLMEELRPHSNMVDRLREKAANLVFLVERGISESEIKKRYRFLARHHVMDIYSLRLAGITSYKQLMEITGISRRKVAQISRDLIFIDFIEPSQSKAEVDRAKQFKAQVRQLRNDRPGIPNEEIARTLGVSLKSVRDAIAVLIRVGDIEPRRERSKQRKPKAVQDLQIAIEQLRNERPDLERADIAKELHVPIGSVTYYIDNLLAENRINPRTPAYLREEKRRRLSEGYIQIMAEDPEKEWNFWQIRKRFLPKSDLRTIKSLHDELATLQPVPKIRAWKQPNTRT
jgi:transposase